MCNFKVGLSSLINYWVKYKEKVNDVSYSEQNVETTCNSKLKLTEIKDLFIERVLTVKYELCMLLTAYLKLLKLRIFSG